MVACFGYLKATYSYTVGDIASHIAPMTLLRMLNALSSTTQSIMLPTHSQDFYQFTIRKYMTLYYCEQVCTTPIQTRTEALSAVVQVVIELTCINYVPYR